MSSPSNPWWQAAHITWLLLLRRRRFSSVTTSAASLTASEVRFCVFHTGRITTQHSRLEQSVQKRLMGLYLSVIQRSAGSRKAAHPLQILPPDIRQSAKLKSLRCIISKKKKEKIQLNTCRISLLPAP